MADDDFVAEPLPPEPPAEDTVLWGDREWQLAEEAVEDWVKRVLGAEGVSVKWRDRAYERSFEVPYCEIAFGDEVPVGTDDVEYESTDDDRLRTRITGYREVMLSIKMRTRDQRTFRQARRYMGRLRQSLDHPLYEGLLRAAGLGLVDREPVRNIPQRSEDGTRWESTSLLEVKLSLIEEFVDEDADQELGWVERIGVAVGLNGTAPGLAFDVDVTPEDPDDDGP